jgi:hypothetical protein
VKTVFHGFSSYPKFWDSERDDLKNGSWSVECPRMILKSRSKGTPATFSGLGYIKLVADGQLEFKLYTSRQHNAKWGGDNSAFVAGKIIPDSAYYDLAVTDFKGRNWESSELLPDFKWCANGKPIVEGRLAQLSCVGRLPKSTSPKGCRLELEVFDNVSIPCNDETRHRKSVAGKLTTRSRSLNAWRFRCCENDFLLVKEEDESLTIDTHSGAKFPMHFEERVVETLQFVLGYPMHWSIMRKRMGRDLVITLSSKLSSAEKTRLPAPLPIRQLVDPKTHKLTTIYHQRLFEHYLKHVIRFDQMRHTLWGQVIAVHQASTAAFIDAQALTLAVAIESLLGSEFPDMGKPTKRDIKEIQKAQEYLEGWNGNQRIKDRIKGSVSQLLQSRATDKMRELVKKGSITEDQSKAWQRLRNASTHSFQASSIPPEEFGDLLQQVEVLFYHLIFLAIGYRGPYIDFSTPGWPIKNYPTMK